MTTPTGAISFLDVIEEIDGSRTPRPISLNDSDVRLLAGIPSGPITFNDLRGKSIIQPIVITIPSSFSGSAFSVFGGANAEIRWNRSSNASIESNSSSAIKLLTDDARLSEMQVRVRSFSTFSGVQLSGISSTVYQSATIPWIISLTRFSAGFSTTRFIIDFREIGNVSNIRTCVCNLSVEVEPFGGSLDDPFS